MSLLSFLNVTHAEESSFSRAFVFCETGGNAFENHVPQLSVFLKEDLKELGEALYVHGFGLSDNVFKGSYQEQSGVNARSIGKSLNLLEDECKEDISGLRKSLFPSLKSWVDKLNNEAGQGSVMVITPHTDDHLALMLSTNFPKIKSSRDFPNVSIDVKDGWLYAYSSPSPSSLSIPTVILMIVGAIGIQYLIYRKYWR